MTKTILLWLLSVAILIGAAELALAQNTTSPEGSPAADNTTNGNQQLMVLAGCLHRGSGAEEYSLSGPALHWWEVKSESVDLRTYLDEDVRVTALRTPDRDGTYTVTDLEVTSPSCAEW